MDKGVKTLTVRYMDVSILLHFPFLLPSQFRKGLQDFVAESLSQWEEDFLRALFAQKGMRRFSQKSWFGWRRAKQTGSCTNRCY